jgi:hypothetical protein
MRETTDDQSHDGASNVLERFRSSSLNQLARVASSIWRACAFPTTPARKLAAFIASGTVNCSISTLRSYGSNSRIKTDRFSRRPATIRLPKWGDKCIAPSTTRSP